MYVKDHIDEENIDFILLDLHMPIQDGWETLNHLKVLYQGRENRPLICAFSGFVNDEIKQNALRAGFDTIIQAPLDSEKIEESILQRLIQQ